MTATRTKLEEAQFFLKKVEKHHWDLLQNGQAIPLLYYVSAFVASARSVTWIMRSEYSKIEGWPEWFEALKPSEEEDRLLRAFASIRNRMQKVDPVILHMNIYGTVGTEPIEAVLDPDRPRPPVRYTAEIREATEGGDAPVFAIAEVTGMDVSISELEEMSLLKAGRRYIAFLRQVVELCEQRFGKPAARSAEASS